MLDDTGGAAAAFEKLAAALQEGWRTHPEVPQGVRLQLEIAVGEIAANIVEHAQAVRITIELTLPTPDQVEIRLADDGLPAEVDPATAQLPDDLAERGRGLALAQAVLEGLIYCRDGATNRWTLLSQRFVPERQG